jgi:hypothetical protein
VGGIVICIQEVRCIDIDRYCIIIMFLFLVEVVLLGQPYQVEEAFLFLEA